MLIGEGCRGALVHGHPGRCRADRREDGSRAQDGRHRREGRASPHSGLAERQRTAELVAHGPNRTWSWDITKLHGPAKWTYYYLYSIIDIYSRYTVGWMDATKESKELAERLLGDTIARQNIDRDQPTIHADRGSSMASKPVAFLLADLGVTESHSSRAAAMTTRSPRPSSKP